MSNAREIPSLKKVMDTLSPKFLHMESTIRTLHQALEEGHNVILFGPPGHGKSEITQEFLEMIYPKEKIFKTQFGKGTALEDVLGDIDFKAFQEEGKRRYNLDESFLAYDAAIFEEMFNARPAILQNLIDILMSKEYCVGNASGALCYKMQTHIIVACTNIDPRKWQETASDEVRDVYKAFNERFVLQRIVEWPSYTADDYQKLFSLRISTQLSAELMSFAEMCAHAYQEGQMITPRTAVKAAKSYERYGMLGLDSYQDISANLLPHFTKVHNDRKQLAVIKGLIKQAKDFAMLKPPSDMGELAKYSQESERLFQSLSTTECPYYSEVLIEVGEVTQNLRKLGQAAREKVMNILLSTK